MPFCIGVLAASTRAPEEKDDAVAANTEFPEAVCPSALVITSKASTDIISF